MCIFVEVGRGCIRDSQPDLILNLTSASLILCDRYSCFTSIVSVLKCPTDQGGIENERNRTVTILCVYVNVGHSNKCK